MPRDTLRRRSVLTGAAWTVPAVAVASAAPSVAASGPPALLGSGAIVRNSCTGTATASGTVSVTFDARPSFTTTTQPTAGTWVTNVPISASVTSATLTIYVDSRFTNVSWAYAGTASNQRQWSLPKLDSSAPASAGLVAYTSTYQPTLTPAWTRVDGAQPPYAVATYGSYFTLSATTPANTCSGVFSFRNSRAAPLSDGTLLTNAKPVATA